MSTTTFIEALRKLREELPKRVAEDIMSVDLAKDCPLRSALMRGAMEGKVIEIIWRKK